jgi:hypothetical protein
LIPPALPCAVFGVTTLLVLLRTLRFSPLLAVPLSLRSGIFDLYLFGLAERWLGGILILSTPFDMVASTDDGSTPAGSWSERKNTP